MTTTIRDLSCKIFLEADVAQPGLAELLADGANTRVSPGPSSLLITNDIGEWELRRNDDRDRASAREFPDGFLHFRSVIEFYPRATASRDDAVNDIARLLDRLWSIGVPAVASCDYEGELPHHGGYRDRTLPWPSAPRFMALIEASRRSHREKGGIRLDDLRRELGRDDDPGPSPAGEGGQDS